MTQSNVPERSFPAPVGPPGTPGYLLPYDEGPRPAPARLASFLGRRWLTIALAALTVVGVVAFLTLRKDKTYTSSVRILVEPRTFNLEQAGIGAVGVRDQDGTNTEVQLLLSRGVIEPVVDRLDLHAAVRVDDRRVDPTAVFPEFDARPEAAPASYAVSTAGQGVVVRSPAGRVLARGQPGDSLSFGGIDLRLPAALPEGGTTIAVSEFQRAVQSALRRIDAGAVQQDADIIEVVCSAPSPRGARDLCGTVSDSYMELRARLQRSEATNAADFLTTQAQQVGERLAAAEDSLAQYQETNQAVALDQTANEEVRQLAGLQTQRDQIEAERDALRNLIVDLGSGRDPDYRSLVSYPTLLGNEAVSRIVGSIVELENQRSDLAIRRSERNPDVVALDRRINALEGQLSSIADNYERSLNSQIRSLNQSLGERGGALSTIPVRQMETSRLERQVVLLDQLYRQLETRLGEAGIAKAVEMPNVRIVAGASLPFQPASPNVPLNIGLALVLGLAVGVAMALVQETFDTRIRESEGLATETGLPVLGFIPAVRRPHPAVAIGTGNGKDGKGLTRIGWDQRVLREALSSLGVDLAAVGRREGGRLRSVAITSASRGEGKTFIASNLALVRASEGARTLLVDADVRARGVATYFRLDPEPGLTDLIEGQAPTETAIREVEVEQGRRLGVLAPGSSRSFSAAMFEDARFESVIRRVESMYDLVIIDTPPLEFLGDTVALAGSVDSVIVVVREDVTDRNALDRTLERLRRSGGHVVGVVFNDVSAPKYYGSYSYITEDS